MKNNILPHVYFDYNEVTIRDNSIHVHVNLFTIDDSEVPKWSTSKFNNFMKINVCLIMEQWKGTREISQTSANIDTINQGKFVIPKNHPNLKTKKVNSYNSVDMSTLEFENSVIYRYSFQYKIDLPPSQIPSKMNTDLYVYAYTSIDLESMSQVRKLNYRYVENPMWRGTLSSEALLKKSEPVLQTNMFYEAGTNIVWRGPVHRHGDRFMAGAYHTDTNHPFLDKRVIDNNKLKFYDMTRHSFSHSPSGRPNPIEIGNKVKTNYNKSLPFMHEFDTILLDSGEISKIFVLDLANACMGKSKVANKMFNLNKNLYLKISDTLELNKIKIDRITLPKKINFLKKRKRNTRGRKALIPKIPKMTPAKKTPLIKTKNSFLKIKAKSFFMNKNRLLRKKTNGSSKVASIEQLDIGTEQKIRAIQFTDHEIKNFIFGKYSYSLDLTIEDKFLKHVMGVKKNLTSYESYLTSVFTKLKHHFNKNTNKLKKSYLSNFYTGLGIRVDKNLNIIDSTTTSTVKAMAESKFIKDIGYLHDGAELLGINFDDKTFLNKINPITTTKNSFQAAISEVNRLIRLVDLFYGVSAPEANSHTGGGKKSKLKTKIDISKQFKGVYDKDNRRKGRIGYKFISFDKDKPLKISRRSFENRANREVKKYFVGSPNIQMDDISSFPPEVRSDLVNVNKDKYLFFTPEKIKFGNSEIDNSAFDKNNFKSEAFMALGVSKAINKVVNMPPLMVFPDARVEERGMYVDASDYLGQQTLVKLKLKKAKRRPEILLKDKKLLKDINNALVFMESKAKKSRIHLNMRNPPIKKDKSINLLDLNDESSAFYAGLKDGNIKPKDIPLQIKSLLLSRSDSVKNNIVKNGIDIFSNPNTSEMAYQNFSNIRKTLMFDGFQKKNGLNVINSPIMKEMTSENYSKSSGISKLCKTISFDGKFARKQEDDYETFGSSFLLEEPKYVERRVTKVKRRGNPRNVAKIIIQSLTMGTSMFCSTVVLRQNENQENIIAPLKRKRNRFSTDSSGRQLENLTALMPMGDSGGMKGGY